MPIEFFCPGCGNLMRTPDDTGGRKGRCPNCQTKVMIPKDSVASSDSVSRVEPIADPKLTPAKPTPTAQPKPAAQPSPATKPRAAAAETIEMSCQSCGRSLKVPAANAGKKGKCPNCAAVMQIPEKSQQQSSDAEARWKGSPQPTTAKPAPAQTPQPSPAQPAASPAGSKIEFRCSTCQKLVRVSASAAGQMGQCPQCKSVVKIPTQSTASPGLTPLAGSGPAVGGLTPIGGGAPASGLTPIGNANAPAGGGLTPIGNTSSPGVGGLTPLPNPSAPASALTPIGNSQAAPGLTPLDELSPLDTGSSDPFAGVGGSAAGNDPFAGLGSADLGVPTVGPGQPTANPYAAPQMAGSSASSPGRTRSRSSAATGGILVCGIFLAIVGGGNLITLAFAMVFEDVDAKLERAMRTVDEEDEASATVGLLAIRYTSALVMAAGGGLTLAGGIQMCRLKTRGLCIAGSIFAMLPCGCFCFIGIPIGIWGLVVLNQNSTASLFT